MIAAAQHTAPEVTALGQEIDPGDAVAHAIVAIGHRRQQRVEVGDSRRIDSHAAGLDRKEADRGIEHHPGQAHAPDGRPEQRRVVTRTDDRGRAVGQHQGDCLDVAADRAIDVMVLAVYVAGYGTADRHESGARRHRKKETSGHDRAQQRIDADARTDGDQTRRGLEHDVGGAGRETEHQSSAVLCRVAVAPSEAPGQRPTGTDLFQRRGDSL